MFLLKKAENGLDSAYLALLQLQLGQIAMGEGGVGMRYPKPFSSFLSRNIVAPKSGKSRVECSE